MDRRLFLTRTAGYTAVALAANGRLLAASAAEADGNKAVPFDRSWLVGEAERLAKSDFVEPQMKLPADFADLGYDQYRDIRFRPDAEIWANERRGFTLDLLHPGFLYKTPVEINLVINGEARLIPFSTALFSYGPKLTPPQSNDGLAYSGFRVRYPINRPDVLDEFLIFQGASYFRAIARDQLYGLSARGLAINTAAAGGEEFPLFTRFWIEQPAQGAATLVLHALLDSPSVTGAYRFTVHPGEETAMDIELTLFPRVALENIGFAPLTSMFLFDTSNRGRFDDFRNAVHDSGGLQMISGNGERIWRPLANPLALQVSSFTDTDPKGFGLVQRRRDFTDYQDYEARYELRPSAWVEPTSAWHAGQVELVEIPTGREANDNIVAFWRPKQGVAAGEPYGLSYRLHWCSLPPDNAPVARVTATRSGLTLDGKRRIFVVDFATGAVIPNDLQTMLTASAGKVTDVTGEVVQPISSYRVSFTFNPANLDLSEFRLQLMSAGKPWSETWLYRWTK